MKRERRLALRKLLETGQHAKILIDIHELETEIDHLRNIIRTAADEFGISARGPNDQIDELSTLIRQLNDQIEWLNTR